MIEYLGKLRHASIPGLLVLVATWWSGAIFSCAAPPSEGWACTNSWVVVDTETTGFKAPVYVIEVAAQRMVGWLPDGPAFRVLIDHGVAIPAESARVHGYDAAYLSTHGVSPGKAYAAMREYVAGAPLVCHNLAYDWSRALLPEWKRLGIEPIGRPGFCSLLLARRVLSDVPGHGLVALRAHYGYDVGVSHHADGDVATTVRLLQEQIAPRLESAGITELAAIQTFSRRTPIAACRALILAAAAGASEEPRMNHAASTNGH